MNLSLTVNCWVKNRTPLLIIIIPYGQTVVMMKMKPMDLVIPNSKMKLKLPLKPNDSRLSFTSWRWTGGWQRSCSSAAGCTPSPRPPRCRKCTATVCLSAAGAGLSIRRWPRWTPQLNFWLSPSPQSFIHSHQLITKCNPSAAPPASPASSLLFLRDPRRLKAKSWPRFVTTKHFLFPIQTSTPQGLVRLCEARRVEASRSHLSLSLSLSLTSFLPPPFLSVLLHSCPHPPSGTPLFFFFLQAHQLFRVSVSSSHESGHVKMVKSISN